MEDFFNEDIDPSSVTIDCYVYGAAPGEDFLELYMPTVTLNNLIGDFPIDVNDPESERIPGSVFFNIYMRAIRQATLEIGNILNRPETFKQSKFIIQFKGQNYIGNIPMEEPEEEETE